MIKSWKTTLTGIMSFIVLAWNQVQFLLDGDPGTNPDWTIVITGLITMVGLISARDNDVSSENAGAK